eukprot:TRINITY_DN21032_c0_g1_i1.p1 TRINITY_DN21032_c0_g1~~TRINITY_DN21032_c0_g1_i1.p1  ORF type:complete len:314 (-),score=24.86 TRINITY_DN21032_c0_g1_i1:191-1132(-)
MAREMNSSRLRPVDYEAVGRKLLEDVGLGSSAAPKRYSPADPIYLHPHTSAALFVGGAKFACDREALNAHGITRIVYCQGDTEGRMPFASDDMFRYLRFPIGTWRSDSRFIRAPITGRVSAVPPTVPGPELSSGAPDHDTKIVDTAGVSLPMGVRALAGGRGRGRGPHGPPPTVRSPPMASLRFTPSVHPPSGEAVATFFRPLFEFVSEELSAGRNVLIHCLAGAHRAGTAGIACLMFLAGLPLDTAVRTAQAARPAICPIGDFPLLLRGLQTALDQRLLTGVGQALTAGAVPPPGAEGRADAAASESSPALR